MRRARTHVLATLSLVLLMQNSPVCLAETAGETLKVENDCFQQLTSHVSKEEWKKLRQSADAAFKAEHYRESLPLYKKALYATERLDGKEEETVNDVDLAVSVASNYAKLGDFDRAKRFYASLLPEDLSNETADYPRFTIRVLNGLAGIDLTQGYYANVKTRCDLAKKVASKGNVVNPDTVGSDNMLAEALRQQGNLAEAEAKYTDNLKLAEGLGSDGKAVKAEALEGLTNIYVAKYDYSKAKESAEQSLALRKDAFGEDSLETASSLLALAGSLDDSDPFQAKQLRLKALSIQTGILGNSANPAIARSLLALTSHRSYRPYTSGEHFCQSALHSVEGLLDADSPFAAECLVTLARIYLAEYKLKPGREAIKQAIAIRTKAFGADGLPLAECYDILGYIELRDALEKNRGLSLALGGGRKRDSAPLACPGAEGMIAKAIEISNRFIGKDCIESACYMRDLAYVKGAALKSSEAEALATKAVAIVERKFSDQDELVTSAREALLYVYKKQNKYNEAIALLSKMLESQLKDTGIYNETAADLAVRLERLRQSQSSSMQKTTKSVGKPKRSGSLTDYFGPRLKLLQLLPVEYTGLQNTMTLITGQLENDSQRTINMGAATSTEEQLRASERNYGSESPCIDIKLMEYAHEQAEANNFDVAAKTYARVLRINDAAYGADHPISLWTLNDYANLLEKMGKPKEAEAMKARSKAIQASLPSEPGKH